MVPGSVSGALIQASEPGAAVDRQRWQIACIPLKPLYPGDCAWRRKLEAWMPHFPAFAVTDRTATSLGFRVRRDSDLLTGFAHGVVAGMDQAGEILMAVRRRRIGHGG